MRRPAIFISHSAKELEESRAVEALHDFLEQQGFKVLLDRELLWTGDDWEQNIRHWLDVCHGAVVVLSANALTSPWVHTEASILVQRARRASSFNVVPLAVGGVEPAAIAGSALHSTGLPALQIESWAAGAPVPESVGTAFAGLLREAQLGSPVYLLELALAEKLGKLRPATIVQTGRNLDLELDTYKHGQDPVESLAQGLVEARHDLQIKACTELAAIADLDVGSKVYGLIWPRSWVPLTVTARLREVALGNGRRWLGVSATESETYKMYVRNGDFRWQLGRPNVRSESAGAELMKELTEFVAAACGYLEGEPFEVKDLNLLLEQEPLFVLLPDPPLPVDVLDEVARQLPNLVLLLRVPPPDGEPLPAQVTVLEPLDPESEAELVKAHLSMQRKLKKQQEDQA